MYRACKSVALILLCFFAGHVQSWNQQIHGDIVLQAVQRLPPAEARFFVDLAQAFSISQGESGFNQEQSLRWFGSWADRVRDDPVDLLFRSRNIMLPSSFKPIAKYSSAQWHYQNITSYPSAAIKVCALKNPGKLLGMLTLIEGELKQPLDPSQLSLLLAFFVHLVADAHQPLHTITGLKNCDSDRGGNGFCLDKACKQNLHSYWDAAAGLPRFEIAQVTREGQVNYREWAKENATHAEFIYQTPKGKRPSKSYQRQAHIIAQQRLRAAVIRLNFLLHEIYLWQQQPK